MVPKKSLRKITIPKPLTIKAYKELIDSQTDTIDLIPLYPANSNDEYSLNLVYKTTDDSIVFPFNRSANMLFIKKSEVDLSMWFESKKPLIIWPLVKSEFITWIDKIQRVKEAF